MTKISDAEFEELLRSIHQQAASDEESHLHETKQVLRQRIATLFEKPLPTEELPH